MRTTAPAVLALAAFASAQLKRQAAVNDYVPTTISCPRPAEGVSLIRSADSLSSDEQTYTDARLSKASEALSAWLTKALPGVSTEQLPKLALALSGGGTKAGLTTAGAVYGLDGRESSDSSVAGLLQSMTYISALSGGSLTLSGMMANDFEQVSTLRTELLQKSYQNVFASVITNIAAVVCMYASDFQDAHTDDIASVPLWATRLLQAIQQPWSTSTAKDCRTTTSRHLEAMTSIGQTSHRNPVSKTTRLRIQSSPSRRLMLPLECVDRICSRPSGKCRHLSLVVSMRWSARSTRPSIWEAQAKGTALLASIILASSPPSRRTSCFR